MRDITLWQQTSTTEAGVVTETISLFNLIVALIIVVITYILVRNIPGILEVLIFSRVKLSPGTPYTITKLLTYILVAVGGACCRARSHSPEIRNGGCAECVGNVAVFSIRIGKASSGEYQNCCREPFAFS